jgi:hypothetical protein
MCNSSLPAGRRVIIIASCLFLAAFILRYYFINAGLFYTDAVIAAQKVEATYKTGVLQYAHGVGYPGNVLTNLVFYFVGINIFHATSAESTILFTSVFFASLSIAIYYLLLLRVTKSEMVSLSAALILNILPVYLSTSTYGMSHQAAGFFFLTAFYCAGAGGNNGSRLLLVLASICFGWACAIRFESIQMAPLLLLFYLNGRKNIEPSGSSRVQDLIPDILSLAIPGVAVLAGAYLPMISSQGISPIINGLKYNRWLGVWVSDLTPGVLSLITISVTPFGWALCGAGYIYLLWKRAWFILLIIAVWSCYLITLANIATAEDRHSIPALMGIIAAMGYGVKFISEKTRAWVGCCVVPALILVMAVRIMPLLKMRTTFLGQKYFAQSVRLAIPPNSVVIAVDETPHLQYYGGITTMTHPLNGNDDEIKKNISEIKMLLEKNIKVYVIDSALAYDDLSGLVLVPNPDEPEPNKFLHAIM